MDIISSFCNSALTKLSPKSTILNSINDDEQKKLSNIIRILLIYCDKSAFIEKFLTGYISLGECLEKSCSNKNSSGFRSLQFSILFKKIYDNFPEMLIIGYPILTNVYINEQIKDIMKRYLGINHSGIKDDDGEMLYSLLKRLLEDKDYIIDLSNMPLQGLYLKNINFRMLNIKGANICGADLSGIVFNSKMQLTIYDNLDSIYNEYVEKASSDYHSEMELFLTANFNHLKNTTGSWLNAIDSIDNNYPDVKIDAMKQIITWLKNRNVDITLIIMPLTNIFLKNDIYLKNDDICEFILNEIMPILVKVINSGQVKLKEAKIRDETFKKYIKLAEIE
ncbi:MAG: hypothetical protein ACK5Z5_06495 [Neisseriaceae bacterium]|jgi:hypothetical protein